MRPPPLGRLIVAPALVLVGSLVVLGPGTPADAVVSGSNGLIAFESTRTGSDREIWTVDPDGSGLTQLTTNGVHDRDPAWSPDGTQIAFTRDKTDGSCNAVTPCRAVFVMNADGSGEAQLTTYSTNLQDSGPAWSPDGLTILFATTRPGNQAKRIYSVPGAGGSMTVDLVNSGLGDVGPEWKPDGTGFAFQSNRDGSAELYAAAADGSSQTKITLSGSGTVPGERLGEVSWSPDGGKLAFKGAIFLAADNTKLYTSNADGTGTALLYEPAGGQNVYQPSWSPNGAKIVLSVDTGGANGSELKIVNASTGSASTLASSAGEEDNPSWQPTSGGGSPSPSTSPSPSPSASTSPSPSTSTSPSPSASSSPSPSTSASPSPSPSETPPPPPPGSHVDVGDDYFAPTSVQIARGGILVFDYVGASQHTATDGSGMGLFDSGPVAGGGGSTWFTFTAAGRYTFVCTLHAGMEGTARVPIRVQPGSGGEHREYTVTVATEPATGGFVYDLQLRRPGDDRWSWWKRGFTVPWRTFHPDAGDGTYRFRGRMRLPGAGSAGWSGVARLRIG